MTDLTTLIEHVAAGQPGARDALYAAAYGDLRKLARSRLRQGGRNVFLDTTALVNESYLKFIRSGDFHACHRGAFFAYASSMMRSVIVDAVRERQTLRRGGDSDQITLDTQIGAQLPDGADDVLRVHEALAALEQAAPRLAQVVEMRYFGGYSDAEIGQELQLTDRTVRRDWDKARLLLTVMLKA